MKLFKSRKRRRQQHLGIRERRFEQLERRQLLNADFGTSLPGFGQALNLRDLDTDADGDEYITIGEDTAFPADYLFGDAATGTDFTIAGWFNTATIQTTDVALISNKDWGSGGNPGYIVTVDADGDGNEWKLNASDGNRIDTEWTSFALNEWVYGVVTFDRDGTFLAYHNGVATTPDPDPTPVGTMDTTSLLFDLNIGQDGTGNYSGGDGFVGLVDDVAIWRRALSAAEVTALYNAGTTGSGQDLGALIGTDPGSTGQNIETALVGYYRFEGDINDTNPNTPAKNGVYKTTPDYTGAPAPPADFTGSGTTNNFSDAGNWTEAPGNWQPGRTTVTVAAGTTAAGEGVPGPATLQSGDSYNPRNFVLGTGDETVYVSATGGKLIGRGDQNSYIGAGADVHLDLRNAELSHYSAAEEEEELIIGGRDGETSNVEIVMGTPSSQDSPIISSGPVTHDSSFATGYRRPQAADAVYEFGDNTGTDFSIGLWFNTGVQQTTDISLISNKDWGSGGNPGYIFTLDADGDANEWKLNAGDGENRTDTSWTAAPLNVWHHAFVSFDRDGTFTMYHNGMAVDTDNAAIPGLMDTFGLPDFFDLNIGQDGTGNYGGGQAYVGLIDDAAIWRRAVSAGEVEAIYQAGTEATPRDLAQLFGSTLGGASDPIDTGLVGYYGFEDNLNDTHPGTTPSRDGSYQTTADFAGISSGPSYATGLSGQAISLSSLDDDADGDEFIKIGTGSARVGDDLKLGDIDGDEVTIHMNANAKILVPDVFYPGDAAVNLTVVQRDNSEVNALWDTRWFDDGHGDTESISWTQYDNSRNLVARDHTLGDTGGTGDITVSLYDESLFYAGDRVAIGAGGGDEVAINVNDNALFKIGGDSLTDVIFVDSTGEPSAEDPFPQAIDWLLTMGGDAVSPQLNVHGGTVEIGRSAYVGIGGSSDAIVTIDGGDFMVKGVGPFDSTSGLQGLGNDGSGSGLTNLWFDNGGDVNLGNTANASGTFYYKSGNVDIARDLNVGFGNASEEGVGTLVLGGQDTAGSNSFNVGGVLAFGYDFVGGADLGDGGMIAMLNSEMTPVTLTALDPTPEAGNVYLGTGATFSLGLSAGYRPATGENVGTYTIIDFDGDILGTQTTFDAADAKDEYGIEYSLTYDDVNDVIQVNLTRVYAPGDANSDGVIDESDQNAVVTNYGRSGDDVRWADGDFNNDNVVNSLDLEYLSPLFTNPTVTISADTLTLAEAAGSATITATLSATSPLPVAVNLGFSGSATTDEDFSVIDDQIVILPGETTGTLVITAVQDELDEPDETLLVEVTTTVNGSEDGTQELAFTILDDDEDDPTGLTASVTATDSGFVADFSATLDPADLNLYDSEQAGLGASDVSVVGDATGPVSGSLVVASSNQQVTFISTGGALPADTYTVTLRSAADGFKDDAGNLLDGDNDGTAGGDLVSTFTVAPTGPGAATIFVPDFTRGPGQSVNLPADSTSGIPLMITGGFGVRAVDVQISYDPVLLEVTGVRPSESLPAGSTVTADTSTAGLVIIQIVSTGDIEGIVSTLAHIDASVPTANAADIYLASQVIDLHDVSVRNGAGTELTVIADDAVHVSNYFADVTGNGRVNAADAARVARIAAQADTGFAAMPLSDPLVVSEISGNGRINALDASLVAQFSALLPVSQIPAIPDGVVVASGAAAVEDFSSLIVLPEAFETAPEATQEDAAPSEAAAGVGPEDWQRALPVDGAESYDFEERSSLEDLDSAFADYDTDNLEELLTELW